MIKPSKSFNSKAFLLIYLAVIALILVLWSSRFNFYPADKRDLPPALVIYLQSPIKPLPQILLYNVADNRVFTNASLIDRWSFVYFTHGFCGEDCASSISLMQSLQAHFANNTNQFLLINYDNHPQSVAALKAMAEKLAGLSLLSKVHEDQLEPLIKTLNFLYLKTETMDGYYWEQEHKIYLIDPKGRFYASFTKAELEQIIQAFIEIRQFYARTE